MRKSAWPARRTASPTGNAIEPTPSFGLARTNGTTTLFTNHMRSSMASNGCSGTTVARAASSRSGWRCMRGRIWASKPAFCEASGKCLVRWSGTDPALTDLARKNAAAIGVGHSFIVFLGDGFYPLNVLNTLKVVPEVCRLFCATASPTEVVLAETDQGRGILGVVDGFSPKGVEDEADIRWRKDLLRQIGYKL